MKLYGHTIQINITELNIPYWEAQLDGAVEHADCISARVRLSHYLMLRFQSWSFD